MKIVLIDTYASYYILFLSVIIITVSCFVGVVVIGILICLVLVFTIRQRLVVIRILKIIRSDVADIPGIYYPGPVRFVG